MYRPDSFAVKDSREITEFIKTYSFGSMTSTDQNGHLVATHLPFLYDPEQNILMGHMARANPQWTNLDGQSVLVVISGPHAYISPSWYEVPRSVPTWNYVAVHLYGQCSVIEEQEELKKVLAQTVQFYEPDSDLPARSDELFYQTMMQAIVGFRIVITEIEGVAKLSQNKPVEVQERVIANLLLSKDPGAQGVARLMQNRIHASD